MGTPHTKNYPNKKTLSFSKKWPLLKCRKTASTASASRFTSEDEESAKPTTTKESDSSSKERTNTTPQNTDLLSVEQTKE